MPTFILAGHDTISLSVTWTLYSLARSPGIQRKLRAELLAVPTDSPSMDELSALPYLDWVVRESLRLFSPAANVFRVAAVDTDIPVKKPFTDRYGNQATSIRIRKGQGIMVPIAAVNRSISIWGADAHEFR